MKAGSRMATGCQSNQATPPGHADTHRHASVSEYMDAVNTVHMFYIFMAQVLLQMKDLCEEMGRIQSGGIICIYAFFFCPLLYIVLQ